MYCAVCKEYKNGEQLIRSGPYGAMWEFLGCHHRLVLRQGNDCVTKTWYSHDNKIILEEHETHL